MFYEFLFPLVRYFTPFNVFQYITFRAAYAAITALLICFLFGPSMIARLRRSEAGESIRADGPESHQAKSGTPTMGGLLMVPAIAISGILWMDISNHYTWVALFSVVAFGTIGFVDDYLKLYHRNSDGMRAGVKFAGQTIVALVITVWLYARGGSTTTQLFFPFFKDPLFELSWFYIPFGVFLLVGCANAVNLTDGLDGLATGLVIMVGLTFAVLAYLAGRVDFAQYLQIVFIPGGGELAIYCLAVVGACVGFLWYNSHPAEIMMGDTGSLALGGAIGVVAMLIKKEILLVVVGGVFVLEVLSVIIQVVSYKTRGKRIFLMAPLHHHFELMGWPETKVVMRLWIIGGLFAILSLSTLKLR